MVCGPSGTGKSRAILEKMHLMCSKYPDMRALMCRKTRASLTQSAMVTFEKMVIPVNESVHWRTGEQEYRYDNGSVIAIGGMDKSIKIMSTEYDFIYVQEATELTEDDWETLYTRCRYGRVPYNQVVGDCNPVYPSHWIKKKADAKTLNLIPSVHKDNPVLWDQMKQEWTPRGVAYMRKLESLSGVRKLRLLYGLWAAAEGMIYLEWNPDFHMVDRFPIPMDWQRIWVIDFGYTNPFVWQCWAVDGDGIAYRTAEIYMTGLLVEDAADLIKAWLRENDEPPPTAVVCDWDAEDRATFERHMNVDTTPANKDVLNGLHTVMSRLRKGDNGKAKLYFMRDSLLEEDVNLLDAMKPISTEQEFDAYEWENHDKKETPKKVGDHGMDCVRYLSTYLEDNDYGWSRGMTV